MFGLFRGRRKSKEREASDQMLRRQRLRGRLYETTSEIVEAMIERHGLTEMAANQVVTRASAIQKGFDLVLVDGLWAFDQRIPDPHKGGAMIAHSADTYRSLSESLNELEVADKMGTLQDRDTVGGIIYQLGFSRDGSAIRDMTAA